MTEEGAICVAGAGSIGCFVGGVLATAGRRVTLLARPRVVAEIRDHGLSLTSCDAADLSVSASRIELSEDPGVLAQAGIVLVTVKSADTPGIAELIARHAAADAIIVSLQNGVGNVDVLRKRLPGHEVLGGMVPFNVIALGDGRYHRATSGDIVVERDDAQTAKRLSLPGLAFRASADIVGVQWGKLLVNLNNALNALSGLPLREQLAQRGWRLLLADQIKEATAALKAEGIKPVSATPLPVGLTAHLLRLPDRLFELLLGRTMKIDRSARSSMWEDLQRGRRTEVDYLQGVIVQLGARHGLDVPISRRVVTLIRAAEAAGKGSPGLMPEQVRP